MLNLSIGVCGIVHTNKHNVLLEVNLSFSIVEIATKYGIGMKMGGNISNLVHEKYASKQKKEGIVFELVDSPLDNTANELFAPEMYGGQEPLENRMKRVECLLYEILQLNNVTHISLIIGDTFEEEEEEVFIVVSEFRKVITEKYKNNAFFEIFAKFKILPHQPFPQ